MTNFQKFDGKTLWLQNENNSRFSTAIMKIIHINSKNKPAIDLRLEFVSVFSVSSIYI